MNKAARVLDAKSNAEVYAAQMTREKDKEIAALREALAKSAVILRTHPKLGTVGQSVLALAESLTA